MGGKSQSGQMKDKILQLLSEREYSAMELAMELDCTISKIDQLIYQTNDSSLIYEYNDGKHTVYGRLKK